jgi:hypothetical protein
MSALWHWADQNHAQFALALLVGGFIAIAVLREAGWAASETFERLTGIAGSARLSLGDAAQRAYDYAMERHLPIAAAADRAKGLGSPVDWFAQSIVKVVPVYGKRHASTASERIAPRLRSQLRVLADGSSLGRGDDADFHEVSVKGGDFNRYLRWARTLR